MPRDDVHVRPTHPITEPIRVLIADDEALVRGGFRVLIDTEPGMIVVGEAGDEATAVELTRQTRPDVVLMDIRMPGVDGLRRRPRSPSSPPGLRPRDSTPTHWPNSPPARGRSSDSSPTD
jgi:hypothetical protein